MESQKVWRPQKMAREKVLVWVMASEVACLSYVALSRCLPSVSLSSVAWRS